MVPIGLVYSIYDSTEEAIRKTIEASQRMIGKEKHNPIVNKHLVLEIKTLKMRLEIKSSQYLPISA
jgi:glutamine synthetase type III